MRLCHLLMQLAEKFLSWRASLGLEKMCRDSWRWQRKTPSALQNKRLRRALALDNAIYSASHGLIMFSWDKTTLNER